MKSFKVSTTAQRKAALAAVIKKVTRGQAVGDTSVLSKYGVSGMVTRLKGHGFLALTDKRGVFLADSSLTTWDPLEILDLLYKNKNAKERQVMARMEKNPPPVQEVVQENLFTPTTGSTRPTAQIVNASGSPFLEETDHIGTVQEGDNFAENIAAALRLADRYQVKNVAQFVADYLKDTR